jgi:hypothetical protein
MVAADAAPSVTSPQAQADVTEKMVQPELRRPKGYDSFLTGRRCRAPPSPVNSPHSPTAATSSPTTIFPL